MGITGGFVDVGGLYDCLAGIYEGLADESILDLYSQIRREKYKSVIDPVSTANFKRVHAQDGETALENDEFLQLCVKASTDEAFAKELLMGGFGLCHDFTQHYNKKPEQTTNGGSKTGVSVDQVEIAPVAFD